MLSLMRPGGHALHRQPPFSSDPAPSSLSVAVGIWGAATLASVQLSFLRTHFLDQESRADLPECRPLVPSKPILTSCSPVAEHPVQRPDCGRQTGRSADLISCVQLPWGPGQPAGILACHSQAIHPIPSSANWGVNLRAVRVVSINELVCRDVPPRKHTCAPNTHTQEALRRFLLAHISSKGLKRATCNTRLTPPAPTSASSKGQRPVRPKQKCHRREGAFPSEGGGGHLSVFTKPPLEGTF